MDPQQVISEEQPMLEHVLAQIGLHRLGVRLDLQGVLEPFSTWLAQQEVQEADVAFVSSLVGAFISQYLVQVRSAERRIEGPHIYLRLPVSGSVAKEFAPYGAAFGLVKSRGSLKGFLASVGT